ncbi:ParB-like protein [Sphingomonas sp. TX0543]|uniref:ParB-like protein n=1 Tax=unclassified Sphingomonas TaxID=196159 RepID=UPI0020160A7A|nr:ParB-like protein [Sphingomonas sp. 3P27F8]
MTVGYREVARKRRDWQERPKDADAHFLSHHLVPAVIGPKKRPWLIDNHHLALALHEAGQESVLVRVVADLSHLAPKSFLTFMDNRNWLHPYDARGTRQSIDDLPKKITKLADDPYRSLAGELRRAGGYAKSDTPFSEFLWADFLRTRLKPALLDKDFDTAVERALKIAHGADAAYLPGYAGPHG